jgi:hypothetical protein
MFALPNLRRTALLVLDWVNIAIQCSNDSGRAQVSAQKTGANLGHHLKP